MWIHWILYIYVVHQAQSCAEPKAYVKNSWLNATDSRKAKNLFASQPCYKKETIKSFIECRVACNEQADCVAHGSVGHNHYICINDSRTESAIIPEHQRRHFFIWKDHLESLSGSVTYWFVDMEHSWSDANSLCFPGHLAYIKTQADFDSIETTQGYLHFSSYWLGAEWVNGEYQWGDGTSITWNNFVQPPSDNGCLRLRSEAMDYLPCSNTIRAVCQG